jgi:hypothetical protein
MDQARKDARLLGATEESIVSEHGPEETLCEVWPENWLAVEAFLVVQTQWSVGMGGATGFDYTRVKAGLEMAGITVSVELFEKLRVIEHAALRAWAGQKQQGQGQAGQVQGQQEASP